MANALSPHQQEAEQAEASLLIQNENQYLRRRVIALNVRVRELLAEIADLKAEPDTEEAEDPEEGQG